MLAVPVDAGPLGAWLEPFVATLGRPAWRRALVLVAGALLAPGRRTVASALRAAGLGHAPGFANHHRVLSEGRWSGLALARRLLVLLVAAFAPHGPVVVALDDTLERRWGRRIPARGIHRDPVRSSHGHFTQGQRPALAVRHAAGARALGRLRLGAALPGRAGALRAVRRRAEQAAQEAHGLGPAGAAAGRPLAAGAARRRGGRQQLALLRRISGGP